MEQVTTQETFIPLQQNMVIIYKAEETEKHSIGRVFHFDLIWFPWKCFNLIIRGNGNQFLSLSVFQETYCFWTCKAQ